MDSLRNLTSLFKTKIFVLLVSLLFSSVQEKMGTMFMKDINSNFSSLLTEFPIETEWGTTIVSSDV